MDARRLPHGAATHDALALHRHILLDGRRAAHVAVFTFALSLRPTVTSSEWVASRDDALWAPSWCGLVPPVSRVSLRCCTPVAFRCCPESTCRRRDASKWPRCATSVITEDTANLAIGSLSALLTFFPIAPVALAAACADLRWDLPNHASVSSFLAVAIAVLARNLEERGVPATSETRWPPPIDLFARQDLVDCECAPSLRPDSLTRSVPV